MAYIRFGIPSIYFRHLEQVIKYRKAVFKVLLLCNPSLEHSAYSWYLIFVWPVLHSLDILFSFASKKLIPFTKYTSSEMCHVYCMNSCWIHTANIEYNTFNLWNVSSSISKPLLWFIDDLKISNTGTVYMFFQSSSIYCKYLSFV